MCGIAVFVPPLRPPPRKECKRVTLYSAKYILGISFSTDRLLSSRNIFFQRYIRFFSSTVKVTLKLCVVNETDLAVQLGF